MPTGVAIPDRRRIDGMRTRRAITLLSMSLALSLAGRVLASEGNVIAHIQRTLGDYLAQRHDVEGVSAVYLHVDLGDPGPVIEAYAGSDGLRGNAPIDGDTLFQIGSNTKHFEAAVVLKLEAQGKLDIRQTLGDWLPQYPAWSHVTIRQLLSMTSPIPNYSETVTIGRIVAADLDHQFSNRELIRAAYPRADNQLPLPAGWFYSNTNNILAALIIEKASGSSLKALFESEFRRIGLRNTFYSQGRYPAAVLARVPAGRYLNAECLSYQGTPCARSTLAPLIGKDVRLQNLSWAGAAGAIISNPRDLARWVRALFGGRVIPQRQLEEMTSLVSQRTGEAVAHAADKDPAFGLDVVQAYNADLGGLFWFYEGETLGYRCIFAYWPQYDLVLTVATNSQPPQGEDQLGDLVLGKVLRILADARIIAALSPTGPPRAAPGGRN
jgi:D-alanyl-D-alanine carboxypeptidase